MDILENAESATLFVCKICDFECRKQSNYNKHILTQKHIRYTNGIQKNADKPICECGKKYNHYSGLWRHKKLCNNNHEKNEMDNENIVIQDASANEIKILTNLVLEVVKSNTELQKQSHELQKQNSDLQKQMIDVCKNIKPSSSITNTNTNSTINSHNKTFNLNFFLNEQCKDAINIKDFVKSIQIEMADAKRVGKEGYVEGISKLIIEKLKATDIYKRPMHCSDAKRETMYIKENDVWNKDESENHEKMIRFVKDVDNKNYDFLVAYGNANPEVFDMDSKSNIPYLFMVTKSTRDDESVLKVIKKIIKEVLINKD